MGCHPKQTFIYMGVETDIYGLFWLPFNCHGADCMTAPLYLVDLPFSAVADTIMLPFMIPKQYKQNLICNEQRRYEDQEKRQQDQARRIRDQALRLDRSPGIFVLTSD